MAFLVLLGLAGTAAWWLAQGGWQGRLVEFDRSEPREAAFLVDINQAAWPELAQTARHRRDSRPANCRFPRSRWPVRRPRGPDKGPRHRPQDARKRSALPPAHAGLARRGGTRARKRGLVALALSTSGDGGLIIRGRLRTHRSAGRLPPYPFAPRETRSVCHILRKRKKSGRKVRPHVRWRALPSCRALWLLRQLGGLSPRRAGRLAP